MSTKLILPKSILLIAFLVFFTNCVNTLEWTDEAEDDSNFDIEDSLSSRDPKFFGIFNKRINKGYSKSTCLAGGKQGHCVKRSVCTRAIGYIPTSVDTGCGFGGTCCILNATCWKDIDERTVKNDLTYLEFRRDTAQAACSTDFKFPKQKNVCQLKLEFKTFNTAQPDNQGNCMTDSVVFKADNLNPSLTICGNTTDDNHLYLHYGDSAQISVGFVISQLESRIEILVKQIKCDDEVNRAPEGCAQYHTARGGMVRAFNHPSQQLNNQIYSACVKGSNAQGSITWTKCDPNSVNDFYITGPLHPTMPATDCNHRDVKDYVVIPGSDQSKYCFENSFQGSGVKTSSKPFILYVYTNEEETVTDFGPPVLPSKCPACFMEDPLDPNTCIPAPGPTCPPHSGDAQNTAFCLRYTRT